MASGSGSVLIRVDVPRHLPKEIAEGIAEFLARALGVDPPGRPIDTNSRTKPAWHVSFRVPADVAGHDQLRRLIQENATLRIGMGEQKAANWLAFIDACLDKMNEAGVPNGAQMEYTHGNTGEVFVIEMRRKTGKTATESAAEAIAAREAALAKLAKMEKDRDGAERLGEEFAIQAALAAHALDGGSLSMEGIRRELANLKACRAEIDARRA